MTIYLQRLLPILLYGCSLFLGFGYQNDTVQKSKIEIAQKYVKEGQSFYFAEEYEKCLELYNKAWNIASELQDYKLMSNVAMKKGSTYLQGGKYKKSLDSYYASYDINEKIGDLDQEVRTISGIVAVLKRLGHLDRAYALTKKMNRLVSKTSLENSNSHILILATSLEIYTAVEEYDSVLHYADIGIKIGNKIDYKKGLVHLYSGKGMAYYHKGDYDSSLNNLFKSVELLKENKIENEFFPKLLTHYYLASCYYQKSDYNRAIDYLLEIINATTEKDVTKIWIIQSYLLLANCYGKQQNFEQAFYWNNEYNRLHKAYEKAKDRTADMIYGKEAENLQHSMTNLKDEYAKNERHKTYAYSIAGLLILVLIGWGVVYHKKQRTNKVVFNELMGKVQALETSIPKETTKSMVIDDQKVVSILKGLDQLEHQQYFLKQRCNLQAMAKRLKTNATYLSKIINTHKQKNFKSYINELRVDYVITTLTDDPKFRKYTIKAIAQDIGFNNSEAFTKAFYKKTGIYPSYFIKQLTKQSTTENKVL
ncbi:AraC family transcriptional regulator [Aquimarina aggregata]|uniref:AraC family transcriptional regulator n=1 Tax=Aquimarina aggregata TaxID=1642818 RepID=UPI00248FEA33|nr:AraC family transcriptional regulator [Aquimarina aggregata]